MSVVAEYAVVVTVVLRVVFTAVEVATGPEQRQKPAVGSEVWTQLAGGPPFLGKQEGPRTVLVLVTVVGMWVVVVATAKAVVATDVEVVDDVEVSMLSSVVWPSQQHIGRPCTSPHG